MEERIKYYLNDTFNLTEIKHIGMYEYTVELFRENEDELWSTQIEDLYSLLQDLETEFEIVEVTSMDISRNWYYVTLYIYSEDVAWLELLFKVF